MYKNIQNLILIGVMMVINVFLLQSCVDGKASSVGNVEGIVTDSSTGKPLKEVMVKIGDSMDVTDQDGNYTLSDLDVGERTITAKGQNYQSFNGTVIINKVSTVIYNIQMIKGADGNAAPFAVVTGPKSVPAGSTVTLSGVISSDPDGSAISCIWEIISKPPGSGALLDSPIMAITEFTPDIKGTYEISLITFDGTSHSEPCLFILTAENRIPVASAGISNSVHIGDSVSLNGAGSQDPDNDALTYHWTVISKPDGSSTTLTDAETSSPSFQADAIGDYLFGLTVNDGTVDSPVSLVKITSANTPPIANAGFCIATLVSMTVSLDGSGTYDADGDPFTYSWRLVSYPGNTVPVLSNTQSLNPSFNVDTKGIYELELTVKDKWSTSTDTVNVVYYQPTVKIPDTGQTEDFTDDFGEDSDYSINPQSYTKLDINGNDLPDDAASWAMVRDNVTGLIWEIKTTDGTIHDKDKTFAWFDSDPLTNGGDAGKYNNGVNTENFIMTLNNDHFGGFSDWRLPTINELRYIMHYDNIIANKNKPILYNTKYFPNTQIGDPSNEIHAGYWSSTTCDLDFSSDARELSFNNEQQWNNLKSKSHFVYAVRGDYKPSQFIDMKDGTILDITTGLMWQKELINGNGNNFLIDTPPSKGGYHDWRLPTINEIVSIFDYSKSRPATYSVFQDKYDPGNAWGTVFLTSTYGPDPLYYSTFFGSSAHDISTLNFEINSSFVISGNHGSISYFRFTRGGN